MELFQLPKVNGPIYPKVYSVELHSVENLAATEYTHTHRHKGIWRFL